MTERFYGKKMKMKFVPFLVTLFISAICFTNSYAETEKTVKQNRLLLEVLEEVTKIATVTWPSALAKQQPRILSQIAVRWARIKNPEKANLLFTRSTKLIKTVTRKSVNSESIRLQIQHLKEIAQAQFEIRYLNERDKTLEEINNHIHKIPLSNIADILTDNIEKGKAHNFQLELLLGELYLDVGKLEKAHAAVSSLEKTRHSLTKQDGHAYYNQWLTRLAVLQIRTGNVTEGLKTLESVEISVAEKFKHSDEEIAATKWDKNEVNFPIADQTRNGMVLEIARAIGNSEDRMIFRNLLNHSMDLSTRPTLHPRLKQHMLSGLINLAAEFDEIDLAMQAFNEFLKLSPDHLYVKSIIGQLILAYAREKDSKKVEELLASYSISRYDHALVLIELGKLEDAFQVIENPERPFRSATPPTAVSRQKYTQIMGKARIKKQGFKKAFSWAKNRITPDDKSNALLGIADFLLKDSVLN